jgi:ubiquinone/menaquinone biosynthesis C-methylase UbiE
MSATGDNKYYNEGWFGRHPRIYTTFVDFILSPLRRKTTNFLDLEVPSLILDVATGTGGQASEFNKSGHAVLGIDLDINMLEKAQEKQGRNRGITFIHGDGTKLPLKPGTFDLVVISYAMHDVPYPIGLGILAEAKRVIKQTGMVCVADYQEPNRNLAAWILYQIALLYESPNFKPFIQRGFHEYLKETGLQLDRQRNLALGAVRVMCLKKA